jgi:hypothetical protein
MIALMETKPALRSSPIVGPKASARTSAARLLFSSLLTRPDVSRSRRRSILTTVVRCHLPPAAPGIPLRFNSSASSRRETMPAAMSVRMVGSKVRARVSAALLIANAPCTPLCGDEVFPRISIRPSYAAFNSAADDKIVSRAQNGRPLAWLPTGGARGGLLLFQAPHESAYTGRVP